jgi:hypothetical protein
VFDPDGNLVLPEGDTSYDVPLERPVTPLVDPLRFAVEISRIDSVEV